MRLTMRRRFDGLKVLSSPKDSEPLRASRWLLPTIPPPAPFLPPATFATALSTPTLLRLTAFPARTLGRAIALWFTFGAIRFCGRGFCARSFGFRSHRFARGAHHFGFGITWFLLCLLRISHPNLCYCTLTLCGAFGGQSGPF